MNRILVLIFICVLIVKNESYSQTINGHVFSEENEIAGASILLKLNNTISEFAFTDSNGKFKFKKIYNDTVEIEVSSLNYEIRKIKFLTKKDTLLKIQLIKKAIVLKEVVIQKELAIRQKKDTTIYNPKFFLDGSEKVLEDLLKKLPGISVKKDGKIFFKEKEIESLMLEGDDLFNSQYTIGSKNIDVDLIESIEAIDNFNTNRVLHKITDSDKVALNLRLKKRETNLSLNVMLENDFLTKYNNSLTGILINPKAKAFSTLSLNNLGIVNTPDFNFSNSNNSTFTKGKNKELLSQGNFPNFLGNTNSLLNNSLYNYTSFGTHLTKKTKTIFGISYYKDKIRQDFLDSSLYKLEETDLVVFSEEIQTKTPKIFSINNTTTYYNGNDIQIESKILLEKVNTNFNNNINNNGLIQKSELGTNSLFFATKTEFTHKTSENSAINLNLFFSDNQSKQNLFIQPGLIDLGMSNSENHQQSTINSSLFYTNLEFYKNLSKLKFKISNITEFQKDNLYTTLYDGQNLTVNNDFINDLDIRNLSNQLKLTAILKRKKFNLSFSTKLWHNSISAREKTNTKTHLLFNFNYKYFINKKNSFTFTINDELKAPTVNNLFEGFVVSSYRNIINNESNLSNIRTRDFKLNYNHSDLYNTFYFNTAAGYTYTDKEFYYVNEITSNIIYNKSVLLDLGNKKLYYDFSLQKLVPFLKTTVRFNVVLSTISSYNFINNSEIRKLNNDALNLELYLYTGFKSKINFQNKINSESNYYKVNDEKASKLTQIRNEFTTIYKLSKSLNLKLEIQTFIPDRMKSKNFNFINFEINYNYEKYNIDIYLKGQNLANISRFENVLVTDYSSSNFSYNLQKRFILLGLNYKIF